MFERPLLQLKYWRLFQYIRDHLLQRLRIVYPSELSVTICPCSHLPSMMYPPQTRRKTDCTLSKLKKNLCKHGNYSSPNHLANYMKTPLTSVLKRYWSQRHMFTTHNPPFYCEEGLQFQMPASENLYSGLSNLIDFQMSIKWLSSQSKIPYTVYNLRNKQRVWPVPAELEGFNVW